MERKVVVCLFISSSFSISISERLNIYQLKQDSLLEIQKEKKQKSFKSIFNDK